MERRIIEYAYAHIYRTLDDPMDKFIVAFMFDLGNNVTATSIATGMHRKTIWEKRKRIKNMLKNLKVPVGTFEDR
jgi:hypothetical protein